MRLLSIELSNFQVHKQTSIEFAAGITTIKGPTDAGKSAILRALRWACLNDLSGDAFIKEGEKFVHVVLCVREGPGVKTEVKRIKASRTNTYELDGFGEFEAVGNSVPAEVAKLLQLSEINFQGQHDSPFWFAESAGEVSRQLNSIVDLSVIDTALSNISTAVRQAQERLNVCSERLEEAKQEYETIKDTERRVKQFQQLKDLQKKADQTQTSRDRLAELLRNARSYRERSSLPPPLAPVEQAYTAWQEDESRLLVLSTLVKRIRQMKVFLDDWNRKAEAAEAKFHRETKGKRCPLCGKIV